MIFCVITMESINRIVATGIVLLGLAGLLGCNDGSEYDTEHEKGVTMSQRSTNSAELEKYAQEHMNGPSIPAKFAYFRALYLNNLKIIGNNETIFQERELNLDISDSLREAAELQKYAQEHMNGPSNSAMFEYLKAISLTDKIIMDQQEVIMNKYNPYPISNTRRSRD